MIDARQAVLAPAGGGGGTALSLVRFGFRTLSALSPALAARAAEQLWFTPPRPRLSENARALLATGERSAIRVNGREVVMWSWGSGPTVLLMHGWGGTASQMGAMVDPLVKGGHRVIAFDAPAHGASGPSRLGRRRSTFLDFADALTAIARDAAPVSAVIAHSGGCTSVAWAIRDGWRVPAAVFIAPMGSPMSYRAVFQRAIGVSDEAMRRFSSRVEELLGFRWEELEVPPVAQVAETPRLMVIHDRDDPETSWREGAELAAAWPDATLMTTVGLGHRRVLRDPECVRAAVEFVRSDVRRSP